VNGQLIITLSGRTIVLRALRTLPDEAHSIDIQYALINQCIAMEDEKHMEMAGRILTGIIYKTVFGDFYKKPKFFDYYNSMVEKGHWNELPYSKEEFDFVDKIIQHNKDFTYNYITLNQITKKYAINNKETGIFFETPQIVFMGIALASMQNQPKDRRMQDVEKAYTYLSDLKMNLPTPSMNALRTSFDRYASCCVIRGGDTADSIHVATSAAYDMTTDQAGIGGALFTRSAGEGVKGNKIVHQGKLPYYRHFSTAVKANKQHSRGGSATMYYTVLDPEIETLLKLKDIRTPDEKRIQFMDYGVCIPPLLIEKVKKNDVWMLVSYKDARELWDSLYTGDEQQFNNLYDQVAADASIPKTFINARSLAIEYMTQRYETGRKYFWNPIEANRHTPFKDPIYLSNLCAEINLPTQEYIDNYDLYKRDGTESQGEIALCFLACIVAGRVSPDEYEDVAYYTLLIVDNTIDLMGYRWQTLAQKVKARRSVGIGYTNIAYLLASNKLKYSSVEGKQLIHRHAEMHSYFLHKASLRLGKEKGNAEWMHKTKYPEGWLPIDTYNRNVDNIAQFTLEYDWESLRQEIIENGGIRNSVLEATPPAETSSQSSYTTNGPYPIRSLVVKKKSGDVINTFVAPGADDPEIAPYYELAWNIPTIDMIQCYAIMQKFHGQGISADEYVDYTKRGRLTTKELLTELAAYIHYGLKSCYYINSKTNDITNDDGTDVEEDDDSCSGGGCKI